MFFDETKVSLKAGKGGDGCMSFLRQSICLRVALMVEMEGKAEKYS